MAICKYCGKYFKPLGIMSHRSSCRKKHMRTTNQSKLEVDYAIYKHNYIEDKLNEGEKNE